MRPRGRSRSSVTLDAGAVTVGVPYDLAPMVVRSRLADVTRELSATRHFTGLTGTIEIDPRTGNRVDVPIVVLNVSPQGDFIVDSAWAQFAGFAIAR